MLVVEGSVARYIFSVQWLEGSIKAMEESSPIQEVDLSEEFTLINTSSNTRKKNP